MITVEHVHIYMKALMRFHLAHFSLPFADLNREYEGHTDFTEVDLGLLIITANVHYTLSLF